MKAADWDATYNKKPTHIDPKEVELLFEKLATPKKPTDFFSYYGVFGIDRDKYPDKVVVHTSTAEGLQKIPLTDERGKPVEVILPTMRGGQVDPTGPVTVIREANCRSKSETTSSGLAGGTTCSIPLHESLTSLRVAATALWQALGQVFLSLKSYRSEKRRKR